MNFKDKLKSLRKEKGLTQKALSEKANISTNTIRLYEKGERAPRLENVRALCEALDVELIDLVGDTPEYSWMLFSDKKETLKSISNDPESYNDTFFDNLFSLIKTLDNLNHSDNKEVSTMIQNIITLIIEFLDPEIVQSWIEIQTGVKVSLEEIRNNRAIQLNSECNDFIKAIYPEYIYIPDQEDD